MLFLVNEEQNFSWENIQKSNVWIDFWINVWVKFAWFTVCGKYKWKKKWKTKREEIINLVLLSIAFPTNYKEKALDIGHYMLWRLDNLAKKHYYHYMRSLKYKS